MRPRHGLRAAVRRDKGKYLRDLSEREAPALYPYLDVLAGLLGHPNSIIQWNAMRTLANLAPADREGKLDCLLDAYLARIRGPVMITAAHAIQGAATIAAAKPHLADRIAAEILGVEKAKYATPECRNVAIGHALEALRKIAPLLADKQLVRAFARRQESNVRPATARKAGRLAAATGATGRAASSASASGSRSRFS